MKLNKIYIGWIDKKWSCSELDPKWVLFYCDFIPEK